MYSESATLNSSKDIIIKEEHQTSNNNDGSPNGTLMAGDDHKPICIPGNSAINIPSKTWKVNIKRSYLLELAAQNNLPFQIVVNSCYMMPKARKAAVILVTTIESNIWIRQPLLLREMYEAELKPYHYHTAMDQEEEDIKICSNLFLN